MHIGTLITLASLALLPRAQAQQTVEQTVPANSDVKVDMDNVCGGVEVVAWDKPSLRISGTLENAEDELMVSGAGARVEIEVRNPDRDDLGCAQLKLELPSGARLDLKAVSADVQIAGLSGSVELETVSGDIQAHGAPAELEIETVSGEVDVFAATPSLQVETVSGDVTVHKARGRIETETVSGEIEIQGGPWSRVEISTVSGDVQLQGAFEPQAAVEIETHSGDVKALLPPLEHAAYALASFSGEIEGFLASREVRGFGPGTTVALLEGDGTTGITITTHSGDIELHQVEP